MGLTDAAWGLGLFLLQAFTASAANTLIETRVQDVTPSAVRASILSVISSATRLVMVPSSILIGWLIVEHSVLFVIKFLAVLCGVLLLYWLFIGMKRLQKVAPQNS